MLRDLERMLRGRPAAVENVTVWWGGRDRIVTPRELAWTEKALGVKWPAGIQAVTAIDVDGDLFPDVLIWSESAGLEVFRNMGNANKAINFFKRSGSSTCVSSSRKPRLFKHPNRVSISHRLA